MTEQGLCVFGRVAIENAGLCMQAMLVFVPLGLPTAPTPRRHCQDKVDVVLLHYISRSVVYLAVLYVVLEQISRSLFAFFGGPRARAGIRSIHYAARPRFNSRPRLRISVTRLTRFETRG